MSKKTFLILLILLVAFAVRIHGITETPPGLTHDEANHGRDSMNILDGELLFYFPLNYGSEPLYNYVVAGSMSLVGEGLFSLRLVNLFFGLLVIAATYLWARLALDRRTALIGAALLAVSFWPLATSRQALRAGLLPFLTAMAAVFFWQILINAMSKAGSSKDVTLTASSTPTGRPFPYVALMGFILFVAATLYTYLAARVLWLMYPTFLLYLLVVQRRLFRAVWLPTVAGLAVAGLLLVPMFAYVRAHPEADTRLEMLDRPLQDLADGNLAPLIQNAGEALLAFVWPGFGDHFLAYNLPGRPVFGLVTVFFFVAGLLICLWRWRRPAFMFVLIWFGIGILPSLITGPEANTTRNMGALPAAYLLPALGFTGLAGRAARRWGSPAKMASSLALLLWIILVAAMTAGDYFFRWGEAADVRAAYQHTLTSTLDYLEEHDRSGPVIISSLYPGAAHDPSIAKVWLAEAAESIRWVDARFAMVFPTGDGAWLVLPSSTPLHPAFTGLVEEIDTVQLQPDDLDPAFGAYRLEVLRWDQGVPTANFGDALTFLGARWLKDLVAPGETAELLTLWRVDDPTRAGPIVPPAFETDMVMFTHVLNRDGAIIAQRDVSDAPSWSWQSGDVIAQVHPVAVPLEIRPGVYETEVGLYDRQSGIRLPVFGAHGEIADDKVFVVPLTVHER